MAMSNLEQDDRKKVLEYAVRIIFCDHRYKQVKGISTLHKTWDMRLEAAIISRADTNPLRARHKGKIAYTDKIEKEHPGFIRFL